MMIALDYLIALALFLGALLLGGVGFLLWKLTKFENENLNE